MGRNKLTTTEIAARYQNLKEILDYYKEQRSNAITDAEKNKLTRKISSTKTAISRFKSIYKDRLFVVEDMPKNRSKIESSIKEKLREIEIKAEKLIQDATNEEDKRRIQERLEAVRLRAKYAYTT